MSYTLIKKYSEQYCHLSFKGMFQDNEVTWDTHFFTLDGYGRYGLEQDIKNTELKQFIDIQPLKGNTFKLIIALNINTISHPNIQKMMIMIKQYKNLSIGRHEYG